ncbi:MAG TPA: glycosyltransferase [Sneathiellales bacterium]|jgi:glycosyltransferase involved in cell wall biosynthesis|nr:glycosyltransferase [Sneathiellales bacterium]
MITVLHLITGLERGGAETALLRLVGATDRRNIRSIVISMTRNGQLKPQFEELGLPLYSLGMKRGVPSVGGIFRLIRILRREKPDILQTWLYHADFLGWLVHRLGGVKNLVWNIRCSKPDAKYERGFGAMFLRLLARLSKSPKAIIANSHAGKSSHQRLGYRPPRWAVLQNGIDLQDFQPSMENRESVRKEIGLKPTDKIIGLVARYDPLKDHATFLGAASLISDRPDTHFVLVGSRIDEKNEIVMKLINELKLEGQVHLLGERKDIARLTSAFDIATCSSIGEGFPNILIEAMACAVPCVTTDVGDAKEVVAETGLVVAPGDSAQLAEGWRSLLAMTAEDRTQLGTSARDRVSGHYTLDASVERYEALYEDLAK